MTIFTAFLAYAALFRITVIVVGMVSVVLGYRLFVRGVMPEGKTEAGAELGGITLTVKNAAPGTCFALFGVVIIVAMLVQGSPELMLEEVADKAGELTGLEESAVASGVLQKTVRLKGPADAVARYDAHLQAGLEHQKAGYIDEAREAYAAALAESAVSLRHAASALNQVAWGYLRQQRLDEALAIARIAVIADGTSPHYFDTLAQIELARGEAEEAVKWAERAVSLDPGNEAHKATLSAARAAKGG